ncbi:MAG: DUF3299 domain-containing protein [Gammaproteobacteria bacterium]|nr:DUF3299 domain-containing protein [Gammaproteobacteria bacterium]
MPSQNLVQYLYKHGDFVDNLFMMTNFNMLRLVFSILLSLTLLSLPVRGQDEDQSQTEVLAVEWVDLMSQADLDAVLNAPQLSHDLYGWQDQLAGNPDGEAYIKALRSYDVNPDLVDKRIMIPGFIVPTAYSEDRRVTEFFLVPFFGACLHLPPPPPNQIIHVSYEQGVPLENFYDAHVVHGLLKSEVNENDIASSAYRLEAEGVSVYSY